MYHPDADSKQVYREWLVIAQGEGGQMKEYRDSLIAAAQKSQDSYDKTILTLCGGALVISFAFLKDYMGERLIENLWSLLAAWISWGLSAILIIASFYCSNRALRKAVGQVDAGTIENEKVGGAYSTATSVLNLLGGVFFLIGVVFMIYFTSTNLHNRRAENDETSRPPAARQTDSSIPSASNPKLP